MSESLPAALLMLLPTVPLALVYVAGIIVALVKIGSHRRASAFALTGFVGLLLGALIRAGGTLMTLPAYRGDLPVKELAIRIAATSYVATFLTVAATAFLIVAIFIDREQPKELRKRREF